MIYVGIVTLHTHLFESIVEELWNVLPGSLVSGLTRLVGVGHGDPRRVGDPGADIVLHLGLPVTGVQADRSLVSRIGA